MILHLAVPAGMVMVHTELLSWWIIQQASQDGDFIKQEWLVT